MLINNLFLNQRNIVSQRQNYNSPVIKFKGTEYCNLNNKEFKIAVVKKFNKLQKRIQLNQE